MLKLKRAAGVLLIAGMLSGMLAGNAWADSTVSSVSLTVSIDFGAGDRLPSIDYEKSDGTCVYSNSSNRYTVDEAEWVTSTSKDMTIGEEPKMKVYLEPGSDYYFKGSYGSSNVSIKGGSFVSAKRSGNQLIVTLKTNPIKGTYEAPSDAYWRDTNDLGRAKWDESDDANAYDVYLYRNSTIVKKLEAYKGTSYNFYPYMTQKGTYRFKVRAVPTTSSGEKYGKKSDWTESDEVYISEEDVSDGSGQDSGQPIENNTQVGWILSGNTWYYRYPDGSYQKNSWLQLNGAWYLFDTDGRMLTGWQNRNDKWYFLRDSGDMLKGWLLKDNKWYYMNETGSNEGAMSVGWIQHNNKWYFANASGALVTGWYQINSNWYYFYPSDCSKAVSTTIDTFTVDADGIWRR